MPNSFIQVLKVKNLNSYDLLDKLERLKEKPFVGSNNKILSLYLIGKNKKDIYLKYNKDLTIFEIIFYLGDKKSVFVNDFGKGEIIESSPDSIVYEEPGDRRYKVYIIKEGSYYLFFIEKIGNSSPRTLLEELYPNCTSIHHSPNITNFSNYTIKGRPPVL